MKPIYKIILALSFWLLAFGFIDAQVNLVYNGYFEIYSQCPNSSSSYPSNMQINYATGWQAAALTPDYFNACASNNTGVSVPQTSRGFQQDCCGGGGYTGAYMLNKNTINNDGREYIGTKLNDTLKAGHKYLASVYVSKTTIFNYAIATIGILFTDTVINLPWAQGFISANPQVKNNTLLADTAVWMLIQDTITSVGNELYLTIGNFNTSLTSDSVKIDTTGIDAAYYFIDGVSVYDVATLGIEQNKNKVDINLYPNPNNGSFTINYTGTGRQVTVEVCNIMGQQVISQTYTNVTVIPVNGLNEGVYFVKVSADNTLLKTSKIVVTK